MKPPTSHSEHYVDVVRKLTPELEELADQIEVEDRIPPRTYELLIENDLLRLTLPEAWGGQGFSVAEYVPVLEEVAKISGALRMMVHGQNGMWRLIEQWGSPEQKEHWLPIHQRGGTFTFGLTEPDNGTGRDISTTAVRDGDEWVINGRKHLISWAGSAELVHLIAATDKDQAGGAVATCFLLPKDTPGVVSTPLPPTMGCKGVHHDVMVFEDCRLPADSVLGEVGQGLHLGLRGFLDVSRLGIAISALGLAHRALELAIDFSKQRVTFGKPIASRQAVKLAIAEMASDIYAVDHAVDGGGGQGTTAVSRSRPRPRCASCSASRWSGGSPTGHSGCTAASATPRRTRSSATTAMRGRCGSRKGPQRSRRSSWPTRCSRTA